MMMIINLPITLKNQKLSINKIFALLKITAIFKKIGFKFSDLIRI
jgi:hypothetical protein